ncbi:hypothetical protein N7519_000396 [Penicillium mononematosum]|uniref:uncharacterized protein n=1 Tax=Penicillium mononematosum TaxID=268346 RepID=UPI002548E98E|nr:uncharacterized protein N7519_000396 [Penicillium mononematosum]KAJ6190375.1 hypothetical protein N7519_000396 [Penicillium mononematosum]
MAYRPAGLRKPVAQREQGLGKRRRSQDDTSETSSSATRRRLNTEPKETSDPTPYPVPDGVSLSDGEIVLSPTNSVSDDRPPVSDDQVSEYHLKGHAYQAWIADPTLAGCRCGRARKTLFELLNANNEKERFTCPENHFGDPPLYIQVDLQQLGLPTSQEKYRFARLLHYGYDRNSDKRESQYQHSIAEGVLIAECIYRYAGPHWSNIAIAQYSFDHPIDTLKYLYFTNVQNDETLPYLQEILYPRYDVDWPKLHRIESQTWEYDTDEYKEILGTKLGKAAACLVIGAWERGTHRIARIHTLGRNYEIHLRFDIEALPTSLTD